MVERNDSVAEKGTAAIGVGEGWPPSPPPPTQPHTNTIGLHALLHVDDPVVDHAVNAELVGAGAVCVEYNFALL
eukprot:5012109-Pyramimonas_sp.AAC.2